ncbi:pyruvate kinase [Eurosta solidaginis]|uniref:pyruvate kinase n=1 Tax=Eurosta solidaginis TaxID=178769 RepID=UPI0035312265
MDEGLLDNICTHVRCSLLSADMAKLNYVREMQHRLQHQKMLTKVLGSDDYVDEIDQEWVCRVHRYNVEESISESLDGDDTLGDEIMVEEEEAAVPQPEESENLEIDVWQGYFKGFQMISETTEGATEENKKCIELLSVVCDEALDSYLHAGVRSFAIDLFYGNFIENQQLILRLRQCELNYSKEIGFPVSSTIFAKLSPRLQYTGLMEPPDLVVELKKGDKITLTNQRELSMHCTKNCVYVNGGFLFNDIHLCDFICIGPNIQVSVRKMDANLRCVVEIGGELKSRSPVLFPSRCSKFLISQEELEDITFCKEVGLNVIVSYIGGTKEYFENLQNALTTLGCKNMRLYARIVLNEIKGCDDDLNWMADSYDGFVVELSPSEQHPEQDILHLCPTADQFIKRVYQLQKVVIFQPTLIAEKRLILEPTYYPHVFLYPDKYILPCDRPVAGFYFFYLYDALAESVIKEALNELPYCDRSLTGSDSLARSIVCASIEMHAPLIFVCSLTGRMAAKIAHFRPKAQIIFITRMRSAEAFISLCHNVILLLYNGKSDDNYYCALYKHFLYGLLYAKSQGIVKHDDNVILVFEESASTRLPNKYVAYKYHSRYFPQHLDKILFSKFPYGFFDYYRGRGVDSKIEAVADVVPTK